MKFFPDENFPRPALIQLQFAGHSALHALEIFPPGTADDVLFDHAQKAGAVGAAMQRHPMGEGQERIFPFPASLKIPAMGPARPATEKYQRAMSDFLSWGERIKGEGERLLPQTKYGPILATKNAKITKRRAKSSRSKPRFSPNQFFSVFSAFFCG
jgi:hypothetical protein